MENPGEFNLVCFIGERMPVELCASGDRLPFAELHSNLANYLDSPE